MPYTYQRRCPAVTVYHFGERGSGLRNKGIVQDCEEIRDQCARDGALFEDPNFPTSEEMVPFNRRPSIRCEWRRPHELTNDPKFFAEGGSRFDVVQGELGDCWLLAAVANLTMIQELFFRVVPEEQSFSENYAGIFHFRFWQYGRWVDVVVDDRLPTRDGNLLFMHSTERNEFWSALLEKAYAKLHGSYEALIGGTCGEAMEDFTGGVTEMYELDLAPPNLFNIMLKAFERCSLLGCYIKADPNVHELELPNGLIQGHDYSVTAVRLIPTVQGKIPLLRIRNPWGNEKEWKGAWSDNSPEWNAVSAEERKELDLTFAADGEFWISFDDFMHNFQKLVICLLNPDSLEEDPITQHHKRWEVTTFEGSWRTGCTAGGCRNYLDTFWMNPQYRVSLEDVDYEDDKVDGDDDGDVCTMIVGLMQKGRRSQRSMGRDFLNIGFVIYDITDYDDVPKPLDMGFLKMNAANALGSETFFNQREVSCRFKLQPGTYCIVPSTFNPGEEGDFVLRVFTEKKNIVVEHDEDIAFFTPEQEIQGTLPEDHKEDEIREAFAKLAGEDMEIDCAEFRELLNLSLQKEFNIRGFTLDVCRSLMATMDVEFSGWLGFDDFLDLWMDLHAYIRIWKNAFTTYDHHNSGYLNTADLRPALRSGGFSINNRVLHTLDTSYGRNQTINFDDFILCCIKLKTEIEDFNDKDPDQSGRATLTLDEWIEMTM